MRWVSRLTTIAIVVVAVGAIVLFVRSKLPDPEIRGSFLTFARFRDGSRLAVGSPVVIAGVRIGDITRIGVEGRFARVDMRLREGLAIPVDAFVTRRADSLFGDSYLEIIATSGEDGAPSARLLQSGEPLSHVIEGGSTDAVLRGMERAMPKIDNALEQIHEAVLEGRKVVAGPFGEGVRSADGWLAAGHIEAPLEEASAALATLEDLSTRGAEATAGAGPDLDRALGTIADGVSTARRGLADTRSSLIQGLQRVRTGLDDVDPAIEQATEVMTAIDEGRGDDVKGTLGRLINDPGLADTLEDATDAGREAVSGFYRFKSWLGMRIEYNVFSGQPRFYATAELRARTDKFYLVELERGGLGGVPSDSLADVAGNATYLRAQEISDELRFTAQFGKQLGRIAVRGGLKDSTFGFGSDAYFLEGRLKISADIFGSFDPVPRLKVGAAFAVFRSIYILAGVDDALNTPGYLRIRSGNTDVPSQFEQLRYGRDWFVGGVLHFDDADLATLLRVYGAALATALAL